MENPLSQKMPLFGMGPMFRRFSPREVGEDELQRVIQAARPPASDWNLQARRWIVVRSQAGKKFLEAATYLKGPLTSAPVVMICIADTLAWKSAPQYVQEMTAQRKITDEEGREALHRLREYYASSPAVAERTALANAFMAVHHTILRALESGLAAYWVTEFNEAKVKTHFHIPDHFLVAALIPMGYGEENPSSAISKQTLQTFVYREKFGEDPAAQPLP